MDDMDDEPGGYSSFRRSKRGWIWALVAVLLLGAGAAAYYHFWWKQRPVEAPPAEPPPPPVAEAPDASVPAPTAEEKAMAKDHLKAISADPEFQKWLAQPDALARFTAAVANIAEGGSPRELLTFMAPAGSFKVQEDARGLRIDPASYQRYDVITRIFTSFDAHAVAQAYQALKPLIQGIYGEVSRPGARFDVALARALQRIASVPVPDDPVKLVPGKGATFAFANDKLEALKPAEKHLIRMGPQNARRIQAKCRELAQTIGLPTVP